MLLIFTDDNEATKTVPTVAKNFDIHQYMNTLDNIDNDNPSENHIQEDQSDSFPLDHNLAGQ